MDFEYSITPGRYRIIVDSWVDGTTPMSGEYTLHVDLD